MSRLLKSFVVTSAIVAGCALFSAAAIAKSHVVQSMIFRLAVDPAK